MQRQAPFVSDRTRGFWSSGADGVLRIAHCDDCGAFHHPPRPFCPKCRGNSIAFAPVSGRGTIHSYTINRYAWSPSMTPPYVIADIELEEQAGLMVQSNVVGCAIEDVRVGMAVSVDFDHVDDVWIPVFTA